MMAPYGTIEKCLNMTTAEAQAHTYTTMKLVLITGLIPIITVLGVAANSAFLFVVYRVNEMRTTTNFYLANLAVADILALLICCTHHLGRYYTSRPADYPHSSPFNSRAACEAPYLLYYLSLFTSVAFVFLVSFERHRAICRPVVHRQTSSRKRTLTLAAIAWIIPIVFICFHMGSFELIDFCINWPQNDDYSKFPKYIMMCKWSKWANISILTFAVCQFVISLSANCIMYIDIVRTVGKTRYNKLKSSNARNHVAKMLAINAFVFFVCLAPVQTFYAGTIITTIFNNVHDGSRVYHDVIIATDMFRDLYWMSIFFSLINSAVNPLVYGGSNPEYRKAFSKALYCFSHKTSMENKHIVGHIEMQKSASSSSNIKV